MQNWNEQQASWDKLRLRVSGAGEVCLVPSWSLTVLSSNSDAAVKAALLSDGGKLRSQTPYFSIYFCSCTESEPRVCVDHIIIISVFSAGGDKEKKTKNDK